MMDSPIMTSGLHNTSGISPHPFNIYPGRTQFHDHFSNTYMANMNAHLAFMTGNADGSHHADLFRGRERSSTQS